MHVLAVNWLDNKIHEDLSILKELLPGTRHINHYMYIRYYNEVVDILIMHIERHGFY